MHKLFIHLYYTTNYTAPHNTTTLYKQIRTLKIHNQDEQPQHYSVHIIVQLYQYLNMPLQDFWYYLIQMLDLPYSDVV